jgi:hypothetical protein
MPFRGLVIAVVASSLLVFVGALLVFSLQGEDEPTLEAGVPAETTVGTVPVATGPDRLVAAVAGPRQPESYLHLVGLDGSNPRPLTERRTRLLPADSSPGLLARQGPDRLRPYALRTRLVERRPAHLRRPRRRNPRPPPDPRPPARDPADLGTRLSDDCLRSGDRRRLLPLCRRRPHGPGLPPHARVAGPLR